MNILVPARMGTFRYKDSTYETDDGLIEYADILTQIKNVYEKYGLKILSKKYRYIDIYIGENDNEFVDDINFDLSVRDKVNMSVEDYETLIINLTKANLYVKYSASCFSDYSDEPGKPLYVISDEYKTYFHNKDNTVFKTIKHIGCPTKDRKFKIVGYNHIVVKPLEMIIAPEKFILISKVNFPEDFMLSDYNEEYEGCCEVIKTYFNRHIKDKNGNEHVYKSIEYNRLINIEVLNASILTHKVID